MAELATVEIDFKLSIIPVGNGLRLKITPHRCGGMDDFKEFPETLVAITPFDVNELTKNYCFKNSEGVTTLFYLK